ncbi:hypothetical protein BDR03DRAFT_484611 [Suillus americanus]|nr:hypothetical protein BDR03DRAFT_484611 [Suillus americanus]
MSWPLPLNLERFDRYVMNDTPICLIRLSDMKFVGRYDVKKYLRGFVPLDRLGGTLSLANL